MAFTSIDKPHGVDTEVWEDFVALRRALKAPVTATAIKGFMREAERACMTLQQALEMSCQMGWRGFRAEWVQRQQRGSFSEQASKQKQDRYAAFTNQHDKGDTIDVSARVLP